MSEQTAPFSDDRPFARFPYADGHGFLTDHVLEEKSKSTRGWENCHYEEKRRDDESNGFGGIIGMSPGLREVLDLVRTVAPTDSTVLIEGETGTGKELIAGAVHSRSRRVGRPFIRLNCAAIPLGLLESELFGHEKGAFTGAISRKIGRFEAAHGGTLFLDEIGDIPLELQSKLLRVLQEGEFERLGSTQTVRVNVRLVTATNGDLWKLVSEKRFRADLYYRLNVFPIEVPALRERAEDIPLLVNHFVAKYALRMQKNIDRVPAAVMDLLKSHRWPGNIRELQNVIERGVILSRGTVLQVPLSSLMPRIVEDNYTSGVGTLEEVERRHILAVLEQTNWVLAGPNGAAARLGFKRSTLQYRLNKLRILRPKRSLAAQAPT
jgi:formate hydrogenlyase transcriptional activator